MLDLAVRVFSLCMALASAEMLHGIARIRYLIPGVGKPNAQKISIVTGTLLAFAVCYLFIPAMGLTTHTAALALGAFLAAFMGFFVNFTVIFSLLRENPVFQNWQEQYELSLIHISEPTRPY